MTVADDVRLVPLLLRPEEVATVLRLDLFVRDGVVVAAAWC
jgi:hypothetical protein